MGAASPYLDIKFEQLETAIKNVFAKKGEDMVKLNLRALRAGRDYAKKST